MLLPGIVKKYFGYVRTKCRRAALENQDGAINQLSAPDRKVSTMEDMNRK